MSASRSSPVQSTSIFLCFSRPVSASHRCCLECELSCNGDSRGERRSVGELRIASDARVAAALVVSGVVLPMTGVVFCEAVLPDVW